MPPDRSQILIDEADPSEILGGSDGGSLGGARISQHPGGSLSGSSEHRDDFVHVSLDFPSELRDEIQPSDSASESQSRPLRRHTSASVRSHSRHHPSSRPPDREPVYRREADLDSPESVSSAEDFANSPDPRPGPRHRQSHHAGYMGTMSGAPYPSSTSSGSTYNYPPIGPPSNQMVHYGHPPPAPYAPPFSPMSGPPAGYPPPHSYQMSHHSGSVVGGSSYGAPSYPPQHQMMPPGPGGYFPPPAQYPPHFPPASPWDHYQRYGPPPMHFAGPLGPHKSTSPSQTSSNPGEQEEMYKKLHDILLSDQKARDAREAERAELEHKARAAELARVEREASDKRIALEAAEKAREELRKEVEAKAAELAARIKAEAEAQAERAASDAKIAAEATAKAKKEMEELQEKAREEAKKEAEAKVAADAAKVAAEAERAASDLKIAEEAAAKVRKELEEAAAAPDKKAVIKFKDAVGRKFNFPFHRCQKWVDMQELILQAFVQVDKLGPLVQEGHYDLLGPNNEIILPQVWETMVEPDWTVTMHMWPMPEPEPAAPPVDVLNLDDLLGPRPNKGKGKGAKKSRPPPPPAPPPPPPPPPDPGLDPIIVISSNTSASKADKASKKAGSKPKKSSTTSSFSSWMGGGPKPAKGGQKSLKEIKKPDGAAGSQHGAATSTGSCTVM